ncbi:MAG: 16S rRNA (guanine(527)-N(7))-methyltransferase RsmG [Lachnospiraceae bacterium]|nr:16S rRNA (guanine(527)-N(7))-methyltransferase RsmG [Lachnospiraceae bacterium]
MSDFYTHLKKSLEALNIQYDDNICHQFYNYYEFLVRWNSCINLTALTEQDDVIDKHFIDSLSLCTYIGLEDQAIIDVGTGAGFPGVPLKIMYPDLKMVLLDSLNKRVRFLDDLIRELGLLNIDVYHGRAETFAKNPKFRESFDLCVSRAVANLSTLSELCLPFVKKGGSFISYKGSDPEDEVLKAENAISLVGGSVNNMYKFKLPFTDISRSIIFIDKNKNTPGKYPRKEGTPSKDPL